MGETRGKEEEKEGGGEGNLVKPVLIMSCNLGATRDFGRRGDTRINLLLVQFTALPGLQPPTPELQCSKTELCRTTRKALQDYVRPPAYLKSYDTTARLMAET